MFTLKNIKFKNILEIDELTIKKGKVTTLVGESGSGKNHSFKII